MLTARFSHPPGYIAQFYANVDSISQRPVQFCTPYGETPERWWYKSEMHSPVTIGEIFDERYELIELLGAGATGTVYKALQLDCKRIVALKILPEKIFSDEQTETRFLQEAKALSQLSHVNLVAVYHLGCTQNGRLYLAMEYIKGKTLQSVLDAQKLTLTEILQLMNRLSDALGYVHSMNIVHRDVKPANIVLTDVPEPNTPKIIDFGLIRVEHSSDQKLTKTEALIGTPHYMSPEQCMGQPATARSDIYSLCVCFYEMLAGQRPFDADNVVGLMYQHINNAVPPLPEAVTQGFGEEISVILDRGLAKKPANRYETMGELQKNIAELQIAIRKAPAHRRNNWSKRSSVAALIVAGVLITVVSSQFLEQMKKSGAATRKQSRSYKTSMTIAGAIAKADASHPDNRTERAYYLNLAHHLAEKKKNMSRQDRLRLHVDYARYLRDSSFPRLCQKVCEEELADEERNKIVDFESFRRQIDLKNVYIETLLQTGEKAKALKVFEETIHPPKRDIDSLPSQDNRYTTANKEGIIANALKIQRLDGIDSSPIIDRLAKFCTSQIDAAKLAGECIKYGRIQNARTFIKSGEEFDLRAGEPEYLGLLELNQACLAFEAGKLKEQNLHLDRAVKCFDKGSVESYFRELEKLSVILAFSGRTTDLIEVLKWISGPAQNYEAPGKSVSANELASLIEKHPENTVYYAEYMLSPGRYSSSEKISMLYKVLNNKEIPHSIKFPLAFLPYQFCKDAGVSRQDYCECTERRAWGMKVNILTQSSIKFYNQLIALEKENLKVKGYPTPKNIPFFYIMQAQNSLTLGSTKDTVMYLNLVDMDAVDDPGEVPCFSVVACEIGDFKKVKALIDRCDNIFRLSSIVDYCLAVHNWENCIAAMKKARMAAIKLNSPDEQRRGQAVCDLLEANVTLEQSDYSPQGMAKAKELVSQALLGSTNLPANEDNRIFLRKLALTAAIVGQFDDAARIQKKADEIKI